MEIAVPSSLPSYKDSFLPEKEHKGGVKARKHLTQTNSDIFVFYFLT